MIKAGIIGATGYAGAELVRLLAGHKDVDIVWYGSRSYINDNYANVYRNFCKIVDARCLDDNLGELADQADVIFTATPQGFLASVLTEEILEKTKVIDLSADFRIKDVAVYEKWYGIEKGRELTAQEIAWAADLIVRWIARDIRRVVSRPNAASQKTKTKTLAAGSMRQRELDLL